MPNEDQAVMDEQIAAVNADSRIKLILTCGAFPEQYDALLGKRPVGYLRLRHGYFSVSCPGVGGEVVFEARTKGDGFFTDDERPAFLQLALIAIEGWLRLCWAREGS